MKNSKNFILFLKLIYLSLNEVLFHWKALFFFFPSYCFKTKTKTKRKQKKQIRVFIVEFIYAK